MSRDVHSCTHWLRPRNAPYPPALGLVYEGELVSQDRRHLFVTLKVHTTARKHDPLQIIQYSLAILYQFPN